jgi:oligopeptide transport system substrate-binding protein
VAADYVYQIKRLADPALHCPIAGLMEDHILGFSELMGETGTESSSPNSTSTW